jgi:CRP-like cAMP-binding protein
MSLGRVLFDIGEYQQYVYFPVDCIVSLQQVLDDGSLTEIGVVGWEGMVGVSSFMNGENCCARALIQHAGSALRLDSNMLIEAFNQDPLIRKLLLHYTQILLNQAGQTAACNRYHRLDQQLCRWILLMLDRLPDNRLTFTQEIISNTLGVCREGITAAAAKMQAAGLISYSRGRITVLDRHGLEQRTCECYAKIKSETDRLLPREAANSRNVTLLHNL